MSTILLSIGSNTFAKTNIDKAKRMLTYLFPNITFSQPILSEPEDDKYKYLFRNVLAILETDESPEEIIDKIKQTERAVGRTPKDKYLGKVVIDIDLLKYGNEILRPQDYEREYVQQLLYMFDIPEATNPSDMPADANSEEFKNNPKPSGSEETTEFQNTDEIPDSNAPNETNAS